MTKHPRQVPLPSSIETFHTTKRHIQYQNVPSSIKSTSLNGLLVKLSKDNGDLYLPDDDLSLFAGLNPYSIEGNAATFIVLKVLDVQKILIIIFVAANFLHRKYYSDC